MNAHTRPHVVVLGSLNMDLVLRVPHMPQAGESVLARTLTHVSGGKGGNQAVSCARQGAAVHLFSSVGDDAYGQQLLAGLQTDGIDTTQVQQQPGCSSGVAVISVDDRAQNQIVVVPGANALLNVSDAQLDAQLASAAYVVLQFETPMTEVGKAIAAAQRTGCRVALNPSPMQPWPAAWWPALELLVVNETEAAQLSGQPVTTPQQAAEAARWCRAQGAAQVVVTLGSQGAVAVDADGARWHQAITVQAVDTTAAGDTFLGALTVRMAQGHRLDDAVQWAIRAASICVTRAGAQPSIPTQDEVAALTAPTSWSPL